MANAATPQANDHTPLTPRPPKKKARGINWPRIGKWVSGGVAILFGLHGAADGITHAAGVEDQAEPYLTLGGLLPGNLEFRLLMMLGVAGVAGIITACIGWRKKQGINVVIENGANVNAPIIIHVKDGTVVHSPSSAATNSALMTNRKAQRRFNATPGSPGRILNFSGLSADDSGLNISSYQASHPQTARSNAVLQEEIRTEDYEKALNLTGFYLCMLVYAVGLEDQGNDTVVNKKVGKERREQLRDKIQVMPIIHKLPKACGWEDCLDNYLKGQDDPLPDHMHQLQHIQNVVNYLALLVVKVCQSKRDGKNEERDIVRNIVQARLSKAKKGGAFFPIAPSVMNELTALDRIVKDPNSGVLLELSISQPGMA